jgi:lysophospholipid acyltransferase (LPLAT)-like uncharacterized protein
VPVQQLKLLLAPPCWQLLGHSWRINETPLPPLPGGEAVIFACLHRDILPAIRYCRPAAPILLVSKSPDGRILSRSLRRDGFGFVRGSTGHDGREGFAGLLRALRRGRHLGIAVDGPKGPFGTIHAGVLLLARRSGAPIVPVTASGRGCLALNTWDRTLVPLPWARVTVTVTAPLRVPPDAGPDLLASLREDLAGRLGMDRQTRPAAAPATDEESTDAHP